MSEHETVVLATPGKPQSTTIHYWTYGPGTGTGDSGGAPAGPEDRTIVMVHGFRGDHHGLELIAQALPHRRVIVPDLPGFGLSGSLPREHDLAAYVDFLRGFIDSLGLERPPVLLGHSFGSIVAAHYAAEYPETIEALVLVNPIASPALKGPRAVLTRLTVLYYELAAQLPERAGLALLRNRIVVRLMSVVMAKTRKPELRRYIHDQHDRHFSTFADRQSLLEAFKTSVSHTAAERAAEISVPTLLIASDRDDISSLAAQERLHERLPGSRLVVIHRVGHLVHYEAPDHAAVAIEEFLADA
jgi:pimeloyl-ACP methyl ester carboxylesterase